MGLNGCFKDHVMELWEFKERTPLVVHHIKVQDMAGGFVKDGHFKYGRIYSCRPQGAMELTLNGRWINDLTHIRANNHPQ